MLLLFVLFVQTTQYITIFALNSNFSKNTTMMEKYIFTLTCLLLLAFFIVFYRPKFPSGIIFPLNNFL